MAFPPNPDVFELKKTFRDVTTSRKDQFINGGDLNQLYREIDGIRTNLGAYFKLEPTFELADVDVASGTVYFGDTRVDFPGGTLTLSSDAFVWVTASGVLESGASFPTYPHFQIADVSWGGAEITGLVDLRSWFSQSSLILSASGIPYTPAVPAHWPPPPPPDNVQDALDELAANVIFAASGVYTPSDPDDWKAPIPTTNSTALDQVGDRLTDVQFFVPPIPSGSEFLVHPRYGNDIVAISGTTGYWSEGVDLSDYRQYYETGAVSGTSEARIVTKYTLPACFDSLDGLSIQTYRSGIPDVMHATLFAGDGTPDSTIAGLDVSPSSPLAFEKQTLVPGSTYSPGETVTIEFRTLLGDETQLARYGEYSLTMT